MFRHPLSRAVALTAGLILATVPLTACEEDGPAEQLGEAIDESVENAGDAVEDATDR